MGTLQKLLVGKDHVNVRLSDSLNAFGILGDVRNCPVACNDAGILPYYHIKYWTQQSDNNCCNLFLQIFMGGG